MIEDYFRSVLELVSGSPVVRNSDISFDRRNDFIGIVRGSIYFSDDSVLHVREFINTQAPDLATVLNEIERAVHLD